MPRMERKLERLAALAVHGSTEGERQNALEKAMLVAAKANLEHKLNVFLGKGGAAPAPDMSGVRLEDGLLFISDVDEGFVTLMSLVAQAFDCAIIRHAPGTHDSEEGETPFTFIGTGAGVESAQDVCVAALEVGVDILWENDYLPADEFWSRLGQELHNSLRSTQKALAESSDAGKALAIVDKNIYKAATERAQSLSTSSEVARVTRNFTPEVLAEAHLAAMRVRESTPA